MSYAKRCAKQRKDNARKESKRKLQANRARESAKQYRWDHLADVAHIGRYEKLVS